MVDLCIDPLVPAVDQPARSGSPADGQRVGSAEGARVRQTQFAQRRRDGIPPDPTANSRQLGSNPLFRCGVADECRLIGAVAEL
jgi:hypothetical protein